MEQNCRHTTLLLESAAKWGICRIQENKVPLISGFLTGLLCYLYALTNKLVNHDEAYSLFTKGATVSSGRWGLGALDTILPNYSMPWINGILALILMTIAVTLLVRILKIHSNVLQGLLSGVVIAFPSLICAFAYMFTVHAFALAFLLAVLSVWLLQKNQPLCWLISLGCMIFSLSIYQSYISVTAGLLVLVLIRQLLEGSDLAGSLRRGFAYVLFLVLSLGLYYVLTQLVLWIKDVSFNAYAGGSLGFSLSGIPAAIGLAYRNFFRFFREGFWGLMPSGTSQILHTICIALGLLLSAAWAVSHFRKDWGRLLLLAALIGILPLAANCMYLFTAADSVHTLVLYGFICVYGFCAITADLCVSQDMPWIRRIGAELISLALSVILLSNVFLANQVWLNLHLRYENAYGFFSTVISQVRQMPEFQEDTKLALIGRYQEPDFYDKQFSYTVNMSGLKGILPDSYSNGEFLTYYLGFSVPIASAEECQSLAETDTVAQMPVYPYYGSIQAVEDFIVVKLS